MDYEILPVCKSLSTKLTRLVLWLVTRVVVTAPHLGMPCLRVSYPVFKNQVREEAFDIEIPDEDAEKIATVKDAVDYMVSGSMSVLDLAAKNHETLLDRKSTRLNSSHRR